MQLELLDNIDLSVAKAGGACFYKNMTNSGYIYEEINIGDITFKAGQSEPVHRWYRLTPSYSPELVRYFLQSFGADSNSLVFDPFSGRGTTAIECQKLGINNLSFEINPLLKEVGARSLNWFRPDAVLFDDFINECRNYVSQFHSASAEEVAMHFETRIPIIHDVYRWWKPTVLKNLIIYRSVSMLEKYKPIQDYLWLAVNKAALDCANIHRNHPTISFDDNHTRDISVSLDIEYNLKTILEDMISLPEKQKDFSNRSKIYCADSVHIDPTNFFGKKADIVITSPPYPNRFSYVHQTRPQLHFMELLEDRKEATNIDLSAIGGTWGRATSILQKELFEPPPPIKDFLCYYEPLSRKSTLMCNYATKYFVDMWMHIKSLNKVSSKNFRGAYVVGNSRLSDIEIFTEVILAKIFELEGFSVEKIISFRKRGGKKRLFETAVAVRK